MDWEFRRNHSTKENSNFVNIIKWTRCWEGKAADINYKNILYKEENNLHFYLQ